MKPIIPFFGCRCGGLRLPFRRKSKFPTTIMILWHSMVWVSFLCHLPDPPQSCLTYFRVARIDLFVPLRAWTRFCSVSVLPQLCSPPNPALLFTQVYQEDSYWNHPVSDPRLVAWVLCGPTAPIVLLCVASHMQSPNCTFISLFQRVIVFSSVLSGPPWEHLLLGFPGFSVDSLFAEWGSGCRTVFAVGKHWPIDPALRLKGLEESLWGSTGSSEATDSSS